MNLMYRNQRAERQRARWGWRCEGFEIFLRNKVFLLLFFLIKELEDRGYLELFPNGAGSCINAGQDSLCYGEVF